MASIVLNNSKVLSDFGRPYIVAELNTSHFGSISTAKSMIDEAKKAGCACVKFQSWSVESLYSQAYYDENPIAQRFVKKFSFTEENLKEVAEYCDAIGIDFSSTPYSKAEVNFLIEHCNVPYIKVASMDLNNTSFLDYIAGTGVPIVLSTGMGDMEEICRAVGTIEKAGNKNICILHCISIYPPEIKTLNLNNIVGLREAFPDYPIGYSDHSIGTEMSSAAVALGACLIEKHFTLNAAKIGMDNQMASEPESMAQLVRNCYQVQIALGGTQRVVNSAEIEQRKEMRRSIVATKNLAAGTELKLEDLDVKRPGIGISASRLHDVVGKTILRDIDKDRMIIESDLAP